MTSVKDTIKELKGTDADFAALVGLSADQIFQRRRVSETFADVRADFALLKWSHFYAATRWDDAAECLQWADENEATVAEMKAYRRALHGEDLTTDADPEPDDFAADAPQGVDVAGEVLRYVGRLAIGKWPLKINLLQNAQWSVFTTADQFDRLL